MNERKNIDKLFQEKFKDFEAEPSEQMWPRIEAKLKEKEDRKVIPFWWKLSGIAVALLIGFALADTYFSPKPGNGNTVVVDGNSTGSGTNPTDGNHNPATSTAPTVAHNEDSGENSNGKSTLENENSNTIVSNSKAEVKKTAASNSAVATAENHGSKAAEKETATIPVERKTKSFRNSQKEQQQIVANVSGKAAYKKAAHSKIKPSVSADPLQKPVQNQEQQTTAAHKTYIDENAIAGQKKKETPSNNTQNVNPAIDASANPMVTSENKKTDSTAIATVVPNALEELLNEKENNLVTKETKVNRWQITSRVAPIYFGSTSNGSPIDPVFAGNSKEYKTNVSVGLGLNHALTKKLSIRTGISQVTLNYNTNDVLVYAGLEGEVLKNVDRAGSSQYLNFGKRSSIGNSRLNAAESELSTDKFNSYINQKMGYIEVPLELSYNLVDRKFGVNIISGVSTLFLNENKITVVSSGLTSKLGQANNLNKTHFSSNIGLGVRYRFFRSFQANFEPMFKYQINTFSKDDGNFKPYFFGLYTGLSYSF